MENSIPTPTDFDYQAFTEYLSGIEDEISPRQVLEGLGAELDELDAELDGYNEQLWGSDKETRRHMAVTAMEAYDLNLLAQDPDFNVRILALCNPAASPSVLDLAVDDAAKNDKYTLMIVANNPNTSGATLHKILDFGGDELEIRNALLAHPNADEILKSKMDVTPEDEEAKLQLRRGRIDRRGNR